MDIEDYVYQFDTDHFQFFLEDSEGPCKNYDLWTSEEERRRWVAAREGLVAVTTLRFGKNTTIRIYFSEKPPSVAMENWDHVVFCGIEIKSSELILRGPETLPTDEIRKAISPGTYRLMVCFSNIKFVEKDFDEFNDYGQDTYTIFGWPGAMNDPSILHSVLA